MLRVFLNEQSLPKTDLGEIAATKLLLTLVGGLKKLKFYRKDICINSITSILKLPVTSGNAYNIGSLFSSLGQYKEEILFLKNLNQRSPLADGVGELISDDEIFHIDDIETIGLALAYMLNGVAISMESEEAWQVAKVSIIRELENESKVLEVNNISNENHADTHKEYLLNDAGCLYESGSELWGNRIEDFPGLTFLPRVQADLDIYENDPVSVASIQRALKMLSTSFVDWKIDGGKAVEYRIKVTPEYEQRKRLCYLKGPSNNKLLYDTHARFTPNAGRIHFYCDTQTKTGSIGYIGEKIEGKLDPSL